MHNLAGYISLYRKMMDWEWYCNIPAKVLYIHLLLKSNYKDNSWEGIEIRRGQCISSVSKLAKETGLTDSQVKTALKNLQKTKEIEIATIANRYTMITICKYDTYQLNQKDIDKPTDNLQFSNEDSKPNDKPDSKPIDNINSNNNKEVTETTKSNLANGLANEIAMNNNSSNNSNNINKEQIGTIHQNQENFDGDFSLLNFKSKLNSNQQNDVIATFVICDENGKQMRWSLYRSYLNSIIERLHYKFWNEDDLKEYYIHLSILLNEKSLFFQLEELHKLLWKSAAWDYTYVDVNNKMSIGVDESLLYNYIQNFAESVQT